MTESFDIQDADTINTLILICKTNLKMNQSLDIGDVDGFQKLSKVSDSLRKSAKLTAAQNKEDKNDFVDSVGELVALCEREGFIPRFYIDQPNDRVDETLLDLKGYTRSLVVEEMNLGNLIEGAMKKMYEEEQKEEDEDIEDELTLDEIEQLKDEDFGEYSDFLEEEEIADEELLKQMEEGQI